MSSMEAGTQLWWTTVATVDRVLLQADEDDDTPPLLRNSVMSSTTAHVFVGSLIGAGFTCVAGALWSLKQVAVKQAVGQGGVNCDYLLEEAAKDIDEVIARAQDIKVIVSEGAGTFLKHQSRNMVVLGLLYSVTNFLLIGLEDGLESDWKYAETEEGQTRHADTITTSFLSSKKTAAAPAVMNGLYSAVAIFAGICVACLGSWFSLKVLAYTNIRAALECRRGIKPAFQAGMKGAAAAAIFAASAAWLGLYIIYVTYASKYDDRDYQSQYNAISGFAVGLVFIAFYQRTAAALYYHTVTAGMLMVQHQLPREDARAMERDDPRNPAVIAHNVGSLLAAAAYAPDAMAYLSAAVTLALTSAQRSEAQAGGHFAKVSLPLMLGGLALACVAAALSFVAFAQPPRDNDRVWCAMRRAYPVYGGAACCLAFLFANLQLPDEVRQYGSSRETAGSQIKYYDPALCFALGLVVVGAAAVVLCRRYTGIKYLALMADAARASEVSFLVYGLAGPFLAAGPLAFLLGLEQYIAGEVGRFAAPYELVGAASCLVLGAAWEGFGEVGAAAQAVAHMAGLPGEAGERSGGLAAAGREARVDARALLALLGIWAQVHTAANFRAQAGVEQPGGHSDWARLLWGACAGVGLVSMFLYAFLMAQTKGANKIAEEIRKQFGAAPGVLEGTARPGYKACVALASRTGATELLVPATLLCTAPVACPFLFGVEFMYGMLFVLAPILLVLVFPLNFAGVMYTASARFIGYGPETESGTGKPNNTHGGTESNAYRNSLQGCIFGWMTIELAAVLGSWATLVSLQAGLMGPFLRSQSYNGIVFDMLDL